MVELELELEGGGRRAADVFEPCDRPDHAWAATSENVPVSAMAAAAAQRVSRDMRRSPKSRVRAALEGRPSRCRRSSRGSSSIGFTGGDLLTVRLSAGTLRGD